MIQTKYDAVENKYDKVVKINNEIIILTSKILTSMGIILYFEFGYFSEL